MFSLDAMTRGQHAISTATTGSSTSLESSSAGATSVHSLDSHYGALGHRGDFKRRRRRATTRSSSKEHRASGGSGKSKSSETTLEMGAAASASSEQLLGRAASTSYLLYHEGRASSEVPLKEATRYPLLGEFESPPRDQKPTPRPRHEDEFVIRSAATGGGGGGDQGQAQKPGKFRYLVAFLIVAGVALSAYASNTMYIAAIEMISNDVLQAGMTSLRAQHLSADPLAVNKNAAAPGTCPVEASLAAVVKSPLLAQLIEEKLLTPLMMMNASQISAHERAAMVRDAQALHEQIDERLAQGQLVDWSISQRGYIFTAHNLGTILLAVPVSRLGLLYGSKTMITWCIGLASLRMLLLPTLASYAPFWATFAFETAVGGIGGCIILLGYPIAAAWLLPDEANFFVAIKVLATMLGTSATNFVSSQLLAAGLAWPWVYYLPGGLLALLGLAWFVWGCDRPLESRHVGRAELELLAGDTIAQRNASVLEDLQRRERGPPPTAAADEEHETLLAPSNSGGKVGAPTAAAECHCPSELERESCPARKLTRKPKWAAIFSCPTMWALILVEFANNWTTKNATLWPTFFSNILHLESATIGIMLGAKGVWALLFGTLFALATRKLIVQRPFQMSLTAYRRWNQLFAVLVYATSVALILLFDCSLLANLGALALQPIVSGFNSISYCQMPLDMSAEDTGILVSVIRLISVGDLLALPVAGYLLSHAPNALAGDRHTWRLVWSVGLLTRLLTSAYFLLVAKARPKSYSRLEPSGPCANLPRLAHGGPGKRRPGGLEIHANGQQPPVVGGDVRYV